MTHEQVTAELTAAGADRVDFSDSFGFITGIAVKAGDKANAVRWRETFDGTLSAVRVLKDWLANNARPC